MYIDDFPWWNVQISIPLTRDEWECIKGSLELTLHDRCIGNEGEMERHIIDRIEKNLRIE